ncbi:MAG TPA: DNA polymerase III subunit gamma/tau [Actinobacteria bacterium]|nr:DNA polymerase III subunit gamma/tau [Actinomycetota bacterium]
MSYISLYRKYRPQTLEEVVGQKHITHTLSNAIKQKKISHAYLFCGPRGTGKTSVAKILAKALNCKDAPTPTPCNKCDACNQINKGSFLDVLEIDAASNRGIDEIRDLREKIRFMPTEGKIKVYIIDEVHMLTAEAFNALLKTLEEPPSHVIFVLATTEPHKVLPTILSRCQRFDFKRILVSDMVARLSEIAKEEAISIEEEALPLIARHAQGSLRDALGTMDQLASFTGKKIVADDVVALLGMTHMKILFDVMEILLKKDTASIFEFVDNLVERGRDPRQFTKDLIEYIRALFVIKNSKTANEIINVTPEVFAQMETQAVNFEGFELMRFLDILGVVHNQMGWNPDARLVLEMALVKLAGPETNLSLERLLGRVEELERQIEGQGMAAIKTNEAKKEVAVQDTVKRSKKIEETERKGSSERVEPKNDDEKLGEEKDDKPCLPTGAAIGREAKRLRAGTGETAVDVNKVKRIWPLVLDKVKKKSMSIYALLMECRPAEDGDSCVVLKFNQGARFHKGEIEKSKNLMFVQECFEEVLGLKVLIRCVLDEEGGPIQNETEEKEDEVLDGENIIELMQRDFDAEITEESNLGEE